MKSSFFRSVIVCLLIVFYGVTAIPIKGCGFPLVEPFFYLNQDSWHPGA